MNFDCRLTTTDAITDLVREMLWRIKSILLVHIYRTVADMVNLYNANVVSYAEYRTAARYHLCASSLDAVDGIQSGVSKEIVVDEFSAFICFNLAPRNLRRDIVMLGLIHRPVTGEGSVHFQRFFYVAPGTSRRSAWHQRHSRQFYEYRHGNHLDMVGRSALGATRV